MRCLARAVVVIPAVVEKINTLIQGRADNAQGILLGDRRDPEMVAADANDGNLGVSAAQFAPADAIGCAHDGYGGSGDATVKAVFAFVLWPEAAFHPAKAAAAAACCRNFRRSMMSPSRSKSTAIREGGGGGWVGGIGGGGGVGESSGLPHNMAGVKSAWGQFLSSCGRRRGHTEDPSASKVDLSRRRKTSYTKGHGFQSCRIRRR